MSVFSNELAVDLGTTSTVVHAGKKGIVVNEPSAVATGRSGVVAGGAAAEQMAGRTPRGTEVVYPVRNRVVTDFDLTAELLRGVLNSPAIGRRLLRPRVALPVSVTLSPVEIRAARESLRVAGAREVHLLPQSIAAALGAGLPAFEAAGNMIIDVGGGGTEVSIISLGEVSVVEFGRTGGEALDQAITHYLRTYYGLQVGARTASQIKCRVGASRAAGPPEAITVKGQDVVRGTPAAIEIKTDEVTAALEEPLDAIVDVVRTAFMNTPAELSGDLFDRGVVMVGGGAQMPGLDVRIRERTGLPVFVAEAGADAVVLGAARALEMPGALAKLDLSR